MSKKRQGTDALPFGRILKQIMTDRELTVRAVAEMAGVSASVVAGWQSGANPHDLKAVAKLAKALQISFKELLLGEPETGQTYATIDELFEETDLFDGICRVSIKKLKPKKGKE